MPDVRGPVTRTLSERAEHLTQRSCPQLERRNPLRFVLAIVLFVVAFLAMGLGIAQKTFLAGPSKVTESAVVDSTAPFTIIDGSTLNAHDGT